MKKISASLLALSLFSALPAFAADTTPAPVPAAIAQHNGPVRIAIVRNLGSDDNTTQFLAGAIKQGRALGFKVDTFLSNGDDAKFRISLIRPSVRNTTASFSRRVAARTLKRWLNVSPRRASRCQHLIPKYRKIFRA